ncbi:MAG: ATP-binding protein [Proteobacteria bacterium]|nr:ATP-binding protein [Pseudomonadota bacterium]
MLAPFRNPLEIVDARLTWAHALLTGGAADALRADLRARVALRAPSATPMGRLRTTFDLDDTQEDALWLLAACELAPSLPTPGVAIVERLTGVIGTGLRRLAAVGLVELDLDPRVPLHRRAIRIDDRALELLRGELAEDPQLVGLARLVVHGDGTFESHDDHDARNTLVVALGPTMADREGALRARAPRTLEVRCGKLADDGDTLTRQLRALVREAALAEATLLFANADQVLARVELDRVVLAHVRGPVLASVEQLPELGGVERAIEVHAVAAPDLVQRRAQWRAQLPAATSEVVDACAERYRLPVDLLASVGRGLVAPALADIQHALRARLDRSLAGVARRVAWTQAWADLVLPEDQLELVRELVARVRHRQTVLRDWGFAAKVGKGTGHSALFSGPPGTGKTMVAGLIARELGLDLYQVDLSKVVSKYIGETEKQLGALFDAAEHGQAILLFDEADALFGKRTEVKSSTDRYANLETNYLLQRLEAFEGICLLTTNHEAAIDPAFLRRLSLHVRVPMPDEEHREALWRAMIPPAAATAGDLDFTELANELAMSGGYIKNAAVRAAYLAAADGGPISMAHFERAARAEYEAMGKVAYRRAA